MPRVCQVDGFRNLGHFIWIPKPLRVLPEDRQFCPCFARPVKAFVQGPGPHTLKGLYAALWKIPVADPTDWEEEVRQAKALVDQYDKDFIAWVVSSGQHFLSDCLSDRELEKLESYSVRKYRELQSQAAHELMEHLHARTPM
jgi:hypothetical protein